MEEEEGGASESFDLDLLPFTLQATILAKLDIPSLCSVASTCKYFNVCVSYVFSFLPTLHLFEIAPTIDLLRPLLPPNPHLTSLKLNCSRLNDESIVHLIKPSLTELCLHNCENFSGRLISEVGRNCSDLRSLSLSSLAERRGHAILDSDLKQLLSGCAQLESLSLKFDVSIFGSHSFGEVWAEGSGQLKALEIGYILSVMATDLLGYAVKSQQPQYQMHVSVLPSLQKLCLSLDLITDSLVSLISKGLKSLTHLELRDSPNIEPVAADDLTNSGLQQINPLGKLKHLSLVRSQEFLLTYFRRVNDLGVLLMADTCSNLESIYLGGFCRVTDTGFRAILHSCTSLHKLKVCNGTQLTDLVFHDISATSLSLTHVSLRWCNRLSNSAISRLAANTDLEILDLRGCRNVGNTAMRAIGALPKLKMLLLDGCNINNEGICCLDQGVVSLVSLSIRGCFMLTDKSISAIFRGSLGQTLQFLDLSNLRNLSDNGVLNLAKSGVRIVELRIRECPLIGDTSVMALASMQVEGGWHGSSFRLLDLYECGWITPLSFRWFKKPYFPRLRWLGVTGSVNRDMVDALAKNRPFLHVACHGEELGTGYWDTKDGLYRREHEEVDELEQWLLEGDDGSDEEMEEY